MNPFEGVERYHFIRRLGEGGMGQVHEVEDTETGTRVALKVLTAVDSENFMRFKREFRAIAEIHHPNLVRFYDLVSANNKIFYTMELVSGALEIPEYLDRDLRHQLGDLTGDEDGTAATIRVALDVSSDRPVACCSIETLLGLLAQILDALEMLHKAGMLHRDLKPANILVDHNGLVKLVDFGVVKFLDDASSPLSKVGFVTGTPEFMAPEQVVGRELTPATDLYALGCVLYSLITARFVFDGEPQDVMWAQYKKYPTPIHELVELPEELAWVIVDLLDKEPQGRPTIPAIRARLGLGPGVAGARVELVSGPKGLGRVQELALLETQMTQAWESNPKLMLIIGTPGMGKSTFLEMGAERARESGALVFNGRCHERETLPYRAFDRVLDELALYLNTLPMEQRRTMLPWIRSLEKVFSSFGVVLERMGLDRSENLQDGSRDEAFSALRSVLDLLAENGPVLLSIDDLHWADPDSLDLLQALLRSDAAGQCGWIILASALATDDGAIPSELLRDFADDNLDVTRVVELEPMVGSEVARLLAQATGEKVSAEDGEEIAQKTGGNPLLVSQLGVLLCDGDSNKLGDVSVETLVELRLAEVSEEARQVMQIVAVYGRAMPVDTLRWTCALERQALDSALNELTYRKILRRSAPSSTHAQVEPEAPKRSKAISTTSLPTPKYDFFLSRLRQAVYSTIPNKTRVSLHKRLAKHLERTIKQKVRQPNGGESTGERLEALVDHWVRAGMNDHVSRYALLAAKRAATKFAYGRAVGLYRQVLEQTDGLSPIKAGRDVTISPVLIYERVSELLELMGNTSAAAEALDAAADICTQAPELEKLADPNTQDGLIALELSPDEQLTTQQRIILRKARLFYDSGEEASCEKVFSQILQELGEDLPLSGSASMTLHLKAAALSIMPKSWRARPTSERDRFAAIVLLSVWETLGSGRPVLAREAELRLRVLAKRLDSDTWPSPLKAFLRQS